MIKEKEYMREAYRLASKLGKDKSTQNCALLVEPTTGEILTYGINNIPDNVKVSADRLLRPAKYLYTEHAERNAIYSAARLGIRTEGLIMYCCWAACADCGRAIIQAGIKELVSHDLSENLNRTDIWNESIRVADLMLEEAGIGHRRIKGRLGGVHIRFNGEIVNP